MKINLQLKIFFTTIQSEGAFFWKIFFNINKKHRRRLFGNRAAKRFKEKYHVENLSDRDFEANSTVQKVKVQNESCLLVKKVRSG